jgi:hypothetical protein
MTFKVVSVIKYFSIITFVFLAIVSCEKPIEDIGVNLINNNNFNSNSLTTEVVAENKNIDSVPISNSGQFLLGVYNDDEFGKLKASIITQLSLNQAGDNYFYGTNTAIDSVILSIPYQATKIENYSDGKPQFSIDSVIGNTDNEFKLSVYELKTFLNVLDPNDPSKLQKYYSDKVFDKENTALYANNFKINPNDTVTYIKRYMPDGITVYDVDTLKLDSKSPKLNIPLNENLIKQLFVDTAGSSEFETLDNFQHAFRGLYIEADELANPNSHLISLNLANSALTIYYSDDEDEGETVDLNGNNVEGEQGVRVKHEYIFPFGAVKSNFLDRDYTNSQQSGSNRLYVQGAAGSMATISILGAEDLDALRQKNWLINDASLTLYVDQNASSNIAPERLLLYNYDDHLQLKDMITEGKSFFDGNLVLDENGNPYKYVFKITDYISDVFNATNTAPVYKLGLKVFNSTDEPANFLDTKIKDYSWTPKGVVLYGNDPSFQDKRATLKISYSELNN